MEIFGDFLGQKNYGRTEFLSVASHFESIINSDTPSNYAVVDVARKIRNMLKRGDAELEKSDKIRLIKAMNKAKVRTLLQNGNGESYRIFRSLDSITNDLLTLI